MPSYQRRRPPPLNLAFRQEPAPSATDAPEPESPETPPGAPPSPESAASTPSPTGAEAEAPSPAESSFPPSNGVPPPPATSIAITSSAAASSVAAITSQAAETTPATSIPALQLSSAEASSATPPSPPFTSQLQQSTGTAVQSNAQPSSIAQSSIVDEASTTAAQAVTSAPDGTFASQNAQATDTVATKVPTTTIITSDPTGAAGEVLETERPQKSAKQSGSTMSKGAEAALITLCVLGFVALIIGAIMFMKRRRRGKQEHMRHAEDAFNPSNTGSLHTPETVHIGHMTRSTVSSGIFAADHDHRPETVSTDPSRSRMQAFNAHPPDVSPIQTPMKSANPFADPPLNKAYDVLRGRPRSTTLTDRGSWVKNPFKDPVSDRFDPFGELQEKARMERMRYIEELRLEQEYLEKERMGLGVDTGARKGSSVTVEGLGVLDRSGDGRGYSQS